MMVGSRNHILVIAAVEVTGEADYGRSSAVVGGLDIQLVREMGRVDCLVEAFHNVHSRYWCSRFQNGSLGIALSRFLHRVASIVFMDSMGTTG